MAKNDISEVASALMKQGMPEGFTPVELELALGQEGDTVTVEYLGLAPDIIMSGKPVHRHKVQNADGKILTVLGAAQLDQFFDTVHKGDLVWILRGGQRKVGAGRITDYKFAVKRG